MHIHRYKYFSYFNCLRVQNNLKSLAVKSKDLQLIFFSVYSSKSNPLGTSVDENNEGEVEFPLPTL